MVLVGMIRCAYFFILLCIFFISPQTLDAYKLSTQEEQFLRTHMLPDGPAKRELDRIFSGYKDPEIAFRWAGCHFLKNVSRLIATHPRIPQYILKAVNYKNQYMQDKFVGLINRNRNINRIVINEQIQRCIRLYNLKHIITPKKYLYHIPGMPDVINDTNYITVVERLDTFCQSCNNHQMAFHLTPDQEREIFIVIAHVGYGDAKPDNIICLKNGKIAFIDTEPIWDVDFLETFPGFSRIIKSIAGMSGKKKFNMMREQLRHAAFEEKKRISFPTRDISLELATICDSNGVCSCGGIKECSNEVPHA